MEFSKLQICVDLFLFSAGYTDVATLLNLPKFTAGQLFYYPVRMMTLLFLFLFSPDGRVALSMTPRCSRIHRGSVLSLREFQSTDLACSSRVFGYWHGAAQLDWI